LRYLFIYLIPNIIFVFALVDDLYMLEHRAIVKWTPWQGETFGCVVRPLEPASSSPAWQTIVPQNLFSETPTFATPDDIGSVIKWTEIG
jgi:hypothetical protein